jgi:starch-binding outer membrane protein, SusD/RagB family
MKNKTKLGILGIMVMTMFSFHSCSLDEQIQDELTDKVVTSDPSLLQNLLAPPLGQLRGFWLRESVWGLQEATSDELCFPTRGTDWFDGGVWQANYLHTWSPTHRDVVGTWNALNSAISTCNTALFNLKLETPTDADYLVTYRAQAKFLRCFYEYNLYDLFRKYPVRDPFNLDFSIPPTIFAGDAGFYRLVSIAKSILPSMKLRNPAAGSPDYKTAQYGEPTRDACLMLLAKLYLNKEVYTGVAGWDSCLIYLNQIIDPGNYALANNYFNMFKVDNDANYKKADDEAILVAVLDDHDDYGLDNRVVWATPTFHYNQTLGGAVPAGTNWNGCMAPGGYLESVWVNGTDTANDSRWVDSSIYASTGVVLGFNYGQQFSSTGDSLFTRGGAPLYFTFDWSLKTSNEAMGVRVYKYPIRLVPVNIQRTPNDFLIWRYADALLMKAECLARTGDLPGAKTIVNDLRAKRNAPALSTFALEDILAERGRELYWEGHRRQDMIRFGTFLLPKDQKPDASPATAILLPIPQAAIDGSKGTLTQNPGY